MGFLPLLLSPAIAQSATQPDNYFAAPSRGFVSSAPASHWQQAILTGNGTMGAMVMGKPYDETIFLSHAALYLPQPAGPHNVPLATKLEEIRKLCLAENYGGASGAINAVLKEASFNEERDPFIGACELHLKQPESKSTEYQRAVDFMTAETKVSVTDDNGSFQRCTFASRPDNVIVVRLAGTGKQSTEISFAALKPANSKEQKVIDAGVKSSEESVKDGFLYFRTLFAVQNEYNPNIGFEVVGKVMAKGGRRSESATGISITNADEILVLIKIEPLAKSLGADSNLVVVEKQLDSLPPDYDTLLAAQAKVQGDLMGRASLSLNAPPDDRTKPTEQLNMDSGQMDAPLAKIERAFDAGRYNIICCTGYYPPNLQGLWSATWLAPWSGSFTTNGNLPTAVSFLLMGNTPELMQSYFRYYDKRMSGFRQNARDFYGTRGFHVPAQLTLTPRETNFNAGYPHCFWYAGAAWACQYYYDNYQYTGDKKFLAERAYPMMKEAAAFYEDFLIKGDDGKLMVIPSYSPENAPGGDRGHPTVAVNATMEISAAKQLLGNCITAAKTLGLDSDLQKKWAGMIADLPPYQVAADGSFREWLWKDLPESNQHRHASNLYALYDQMPDEIVHNPALVAAVAHTMDERMKFRTSKHIGMAFGAVDVGLAAEHTGNTEVAQEVINMLAKNFWSNGMASFHDWGGLFNMDISGGFPYLCSSALVYANPGTIRFFPAKPAQWTSGSLKGVRLRGGIVVRDLTWADSKASAVLVSDTDQTVTILQPNGNVNACVLKAGMETKLDLPTP